MSICPPGHAAFVNMMSRCKENALLGFSGTTIKDTWTKPRGRVEAREGGGFGWGGGWGGNADNCD